MNQIITNPDGTLGLFSANTLDFGSLLLGLTSAAQTVTFTNNTANPLSMMSLAVGGDYSQTNDCGDTLPAGQSCTISISFSPQATGARTAILTFTPATAVQLTGEGFDITVSATRPARPRLGDMFGPSSSNMEFDLNVQTTAAARGVVGLSCAGLPAGWHCNLDPAQIRLDGLTTTHVQITPPVRSRRLQTKSLTPFPKTVKIRMTMGKSSRTFNVPLPADGPQ